MFDLGIAAVVTPTEHPSWLRVDFGVGQFPEHGTSVFFTLGFVDREGWYPVRREHF